MHSYRVLGESLSQSFSRHLADPVVGYKIWKVSSRGETTGGPDQSYGTLVWPQGNLFDGIPSHRWFQILDRKFCGRHATVQGCPIHEASWAGVYPRRFKTGNALPTQYHFQTKYLKHYPRTQNVLLLSTISIIFKLKSKSELYWCINTVVKIYYQSISNPNLLFLIQHNLASLSLWPASPCSPVHILSG